MAKKKGESKTNEIKPATCTIEKNVENLGRLEMPTEETELDKTDRNKKILLAALEKSLGVVTTACRAVNLSRQQHYHWMEVDPEYKAAVQALSEVAIDFAESKLHKLIENNDTAATIFYLKTKGKKRGYVERVENMIGEVEQPLFGPEDE